MNIALIGYRGTGKTSVARQLSLRLGWTWVDADVEVELAAGKTISEIFEESGEEFFRDYETSVLHELIQRSRCVFALGGGVIIREENRQTIRGAGSVVWLKASPATIHQRIKADPASITQRPNLTADGGMQEIVEVLANRDMLYRETAVIEVDTENKDVAQVTDEIIARLNLTHSSG